MLKRPAGTLPTSRFKPLHSAAPSFAELPRPLSFPGFGTSPLFICDTLKIKISTCAGACQRSSRSAYLPVERGGPRRQLSHTGSGEVAGRGQAGAASEEQFRRGAGAVIARADGVLPAGKPRTGEPGFLRVDPLPIRFGFRLLGRRGAGLFRGGEPSSCCLPRSRTRSFSASCWPCWITFSRAGDRAGSLARRDVFFVVGGAALGLAAGIARVSGLRQPAGRSRPKPPGARVFQPRPGRADLRPLPARARARAAVGS